MQKQHFEFLYHQRENTVEKGIRTKNHSLANCIDCHVSHDEKGEANIGDNVIISASRPLSKTKMWRLKEITRKVAVA